MDRFKDETECDGRDFSFSEINTFSLEIFLANNLLVD